MNNFPDKAGFQKPDNFLAYGLPSWSIETLKSLFDGFCSWNNLELVLSKFSGYAWHICKNPGKNSPILTEELDERVFLFIG